MTHHKSFVPPTHALLLASPIRPAAPILTLTGPDDSFDILCDPLTGSVTTISTRPGSLCSRRSGVISLSTTTHLNKQYNGANGELHTLESHINIPQKSKDSATKEWINRQETLISRIDARSVSVSSKHPLQPSPLISSSFPDHLVGSSSTSQDMEIGALPRSLPLPNQPSIKVNHSTGVRRSSLSSPAGPPLVNLVTDSDNTSACSGSPAISSAQLLESPGPLAMLSLSQNTRHVSCAITS
jgi:hypothetical protein